MASLGIHQKNFDYEDKTVIDCTSCGTRFFVKNSILAKHTEPNFHCSRCDNVFTVDISTLNNVSPSQTKTSEFTPGLDHKISETSPEFYDPDPSFLDFDAPDIKPVKRSSLAENNPFESKTNNTNSRIFNISREDRSNVPFSAPHETSAGEDFYRSEADLPVTGALNPTSRIDSPLESKPRRKVRALSLLKHVSLFGKSSKQNSEQEPATTPSSGLYPTKKAERWQDLISITTPVLVFLLSLSLVTFYFVSNPSVASGVISAIVPSSPRTAPAGLHIIETDFAKVTLDSGEKIALISGEIQNKTNKKFGTIKLEAQAFDRNGDLIKKTLTNSGAALVNTRVKSLSPSMIETMLSQKSQKNLAIEANKSEKFAIALLGDDLNNAAYFSIRIYSVRAQS